MMEPPSALELIPAPIFRAYDDTFRRGGVDDVIPAAGHRGDRARQQPGEHEVPHRGQPVRGIDVDHCRAGRGAGPDREEAARMRSLGPSPGRGPRRACSRGTCGTTGNCTPPSGRLSGAPRSSGRSWRPAPWNCSGRTRSRRGRCSRARRAPARRSRGGPVRSRPRSTHATRTVTMRPRRARLGPATSSSAAARRGAAPADLAGRAAIQAGRGPD